MKIWEPDGQQYEIWARVEGRGDVLYFGTAVPINGEIDVFGTTKVAAIMVTLPHWRAAGDAVRSIQWLSGLTPRKDRKEYEEDRVVFNYLHTPMYAETREGLTDEYLCAIVMTKSLVEAAGAGSQTDL